MSMNMKYTVGGIVLVGVVALVWWFVAVRGSDTSNTTYDYDTTPNNATDATTTDGAEDEGNEKLVVFECADEKSITAIFYPDDDTHVDLRLSDERSLSVPHAMSASGARYANEDESFVFWNKGNTAFITEGDPYVQTYTECTTTD